MHIKIFRMFASNFAVGYSLCGFTKTKSINGWKMYCIMSIQPLLPFFSPSALLYIQSFISNTPKCNVKVADRKSLKLWYYIYITSGPFHSQFNHHCRDADTWSGRYGFDVMESKQRTRSSSLFLIEKLQGPNAASHRPSFSSIVPHFPFWFRRGNYICLH